MLRQTHPTTNLIDATNNHSIAIVKDFYKNGHRHLQQTFASEKLADRLNKIIVHDQLTEAEQAFISSQDMVFVSTVDEAGQPTVSYKGGNPGFVKVLNERQLAFPGYDGNGMFLTAGNIIDSTKIGLLFIDFSSPNRLRVHGEASVQIENPLRDEYPESEYIVQIEITNIFVNCGRYIHPHKKIGTNQYVPQSGQKTPEPDWKSEAVFSDVLPTAKR
ncbi:hypothetical protein NBRC116494_34830 [Aurantivibrio plasticivorans]